MTKFICKFPDKTYVINPISNIVVENKVITQSGKKVQFSNGELYTDDQVVIDTLKNSIDFGVTLFEDTTEIQETSIPDVEIQEGSGKKKKADAE